MLTTYLKIAWRNFSRNKVSSYINIFGLAIGMAVATLNGLWIWDELSFNKYHHHYDRIAQVMSIQTHEGQKGFNSSMSWPMAMDLKTNYSHYFKHLVLSSWSGDYILSAGEKTSPAPGSIWKMAPRTCSA